jgi:hypothetical protein
LRVYLGSDLVLVSRHGVPPSACLLYTARAYSYVRLERNEAGVVPTVTV